MSNVVEEIKNSLLMTAEMHDMRDSGLQITIDAPHALMLSGVMMLGIEAYHAGAVPASTYNLCLSTYNDITRMFRHCPTIKAYLESALADAQKGKEHAG